MFAHNPTEISVKIIQKKEEEVRAMTHLALMLKVTSFKKASHVSNKQAKDIKFTIITQQTILLFPPEAGIDERR